MPRSISERQRRSSRSVLLVTAPFSTPNAPPLGLITLKQVLQEKGVQSSIKLLSLDYCAEIGFETYSKISSYYPEMECFVGEWIFSAAASGVEDKERFNDYLSKILAPALRKRDPFDHHFFSEVQRLQQEAIKYALKCAEQIAAEHPSVVGFTTMFQQNLCSLAIARQLKQLCPGTFVIFGGANCEGVMGLTLAREYQFIDAVLSGPGEITFPEVALDVIHGRSVRRRKGLYLQKDIAHGLGASTPEYADGYQDLDLLPIPKFGDYLEEYEQKIAPLAAGMQPFLLAEMSRGCWWGQKHHCTFCGLNGDGLAFKAKTPARVLEEIVEISRRHPSLRIDIVDNIVDMKLFEKVFPELAAQDHQPQLFYETKSNLRADQLKLFSKAGVKSIQPGIESLSSHALALMNKGVRAAQNIMLLVWAKQFGVEVLWNFIWGFPGERGHDYEMITRLVPSLAHLDAPKGFGPLRLDRFSPNFVCPEQHGLTDVRPVPAYAFIYENVSQERLSDIAYYFEFDYRVPSAPGSSTRKLCDALEKWRSNLSSAFLVFLEKDDRIVILDTRFPSAERIVILTGIAKAVFLAIDRHKNFKIFVDKQSVACAVDSDNVRRVVDCLIKLNIIIAWEEELIRICTELNELHCSKDLVIATLLDLIEDQEKPQSTRRFPNARTEKVTDECFDFKEIESD